MPTLSCYSHFGFSIERVSDAITHQFGVTNAIILWRWVIWPTAKFSKPWRRHAIAWWQPLAIWRLTWRIIR
jgi:hypothetical protein